MSLPKLSRNRLLARLPEAEQRRLAEFLVPVHLKLGTVIYESGQALAEVYFPIDCIISLLLVMNDGDSAEIAIVGNEGMVGIAQIMGGEITTGRAIVQSEGSAYRIDAGVLRKAFAASTPVRQLLLLYTEALMSQMMQTRAAIFIIPWSSNSAAGC